MSESNFREIQLNTKQVVFLFMAFVVAAVAVFLLGVTVGKGVANGSLASEPTTPVDTVAKGPVPTALPPPTTPKPDELKYHNELQGRGDGRGNPSPTSTPTPRPDPPPPAAVSTPSPTARPTPPPTSKPAATPTPAPVKPAATPAPPPAIGSYFVQVDSFASKDNANKQLQELKSRGITAAFVYTAPTGAARYKTRIGPFDRAAAEAMRARLIKEGLKPSVIR